jgi:hypothetical protein
MRSEEKLKKKKEKNHLSMIQNKKAVMNFLKKKKDIFQR